MGDHVMEYTLRQALADGFRVQGKVCRKAGAETCAVILEGCADDVAYGGFLDPVLEDWTDPKPEAAVPLRILGALHRLVLDGRAPDLAALFPSAGGTAAPDKVWPVAHSVLARETAFIRSYMTRPPQTNEVGRSAMLLGGFLEIAAATGLPLRLLEIGASAGLNLFWDRYRIEAGEFSWGPADAPLTLSCDWEGPAPAMPASVTVASRAGCDRDPVDVRKAEDLRRLESYVWTDQPQRLDRLRRAAAVAAAEPSPLNSEDADTWLPKQLAIPQPGVATVVYHSIFWQYLPGDVQERLRAAITAAAARATPDAPLAWLRMELRDMKTLPELTLTLWPTGETRDLATVHFHGNFVKWR